jgi:hypothetical protein
MIPRFTMRQALSAPDLLGKPRLSRPRWLAGRGQRLSAG